MPLTLAPKGALTWATKFRTKKSNKPEYQSKKVKVPLNNILLSEILSDNISDNNILLSENSLTITF